MARGETFGPLPLYEGEAILPDTAENAMLLFLFIAVVVIAFLFWMLSSLAVKNAELIARILFFVASLLWAITAAAPHAGG